MREVTGARHSSRGKSIMFHAEERVLSEERNRIDQELERSRARYQALSVIEDVTVQSTAEVNLG
jgi:hypothetical protein